MAAPGAGQGPGASPGLEAALQKLALRRKKVLSAEEMELYELAQAAGGAMDPDVFKILLGLLKLNVAPLAVFQMLNSMCAGQRLPSECQAPAAVSLPTLSAPETRAPSCFCSVSSSCGPTSNSAGRTFQVPMVPLTPALSILLNVFLMLHLSYLNWLRSSVWLLIGLHTKLASVIPREHPAEAGAGGVTVCVGAEGTVLVSLAGPQWMEGAEVVREQSCPGPGGVSPSWDARWNLLAVCSHDLLFVGEGW
ncbi:mitotic-spindle organizing protein 2 isoform X4 [Equus caballus]|uniref:mitotic-spindle organizing protein 2 isoform X4 n=2 Tax=Equus caballus TaxID=9796 RepID=UPI0038B2EA4E